LFLFCYGRILITIRRQVNVMASYTTAQKKSNQIQSNVIKTMVFVSAYFAITWTPLDVFYLLVQIVPRLSLLHTAYYALTSVAFVYICTNPFIYAINFDPVRRTLLGLFACKRSSAANSLQSAELMDIQSSSLTGQQTQTAAAKSRTEN